TQYELDLGGKTPVQTGTYARKANAADVYVIADQFGTDLERLVSDPKEPPTPTPLPPTLTPGLTPQPEGTPTPPA
ncbi:MAG: adhesin, partial [Chloroflexi bacterium]|nr:adhesin [Chloroflexota bacterium]